MFLIIQNRLGHYLLNSFFSLILTLLFFEVTEALEGPQKK
jgi:hypothetical protein